MPVKVASWNVNSINARLPTALAVLKAIDADIVALQELKCEDAKFPREAIEDLGYMVETFGQKTYNGVALLSRHRLSDVTRGLPGFGDENSRYIEAIAETPDGVVRVASIYAPNGNPMGSEKFPYKLAFMEALIAHAQTLLGFEERLVLAGDYNIIPRDGDCHDPKAWMGDALFQPESRAAYRRLCHLGLVDAFMQTDGRVHQYTFWDYQAGAWPKDHGIRIDHLMLSPQAADTLQEVLIHRTARGLEKPSDHVPILATLTPPR
jgi:exodeoxyribonuclease III